MPEIEAMARLGLGLPFFYLGMIAAWIISTIDEDDNIPLEVRFAMQVVAACLVLIGLVLAIGNVSIERA